VWRYILKRIAFLIPIILVVSFVVFSLMSLTGDAAYTKAGDSMTEEEINQLREDMGLNDPLIVRYGRYMAGVVRGDLGTSIYGKNVWVEYTSRLPYTLYLTFMAILIMVAVSIPFGIIAAVKQNSWVDTILSFFAMIGLSMPEFWLGLMLIIFFSLNLGWLPTSGADSWKSIILPAFTAGITRASTTTRMTRSSMLDQIRADFLRTARAKGVKESVVITKHALRNALIPIITIIGSQITSLIGGAVAIEVVFAWPGIGNLTVTAIRGNDFTMVTGCVMITTMLVAVLLLVVDIMYAFADPRIKAQYSGGR